MKKLAIAGLAVLTAFALSAVAFAQVPATIDGTLQVTPAKAGTKAKPPVNGRLVDVFNVNKDSNTSLKRIEYTIPKNIKLSGAGFPTCSADAVNQSGESVCEDGKAKGSQVGTGKATAYLGSGPTATPIEFLVKVYVAGPKALTLSLTSNVTNVAFPATISGQTVGFDIPENVQQPVPGLFSYVTSVTADLGRSPGIPASIKKKKTVKVKVNGKTKKKKKTITVPFVSIIGCSGGQHEGSIKAIPNNAAELVASATAPCS